MANTDIATDYEKYGLQFDVYMQEWFFFDRDGVSHYYDDRDECCAAAALYWASEAVEL